MKEQFHSFSWLWKIRYYVHSSFMPTFLHSTSPKMSKARKINRSPKDRNIVLSGLLIQLKIPERVLH